MPELENVVNALIAPLIAFGVVFAVLALVMVGLIFMVPNDKARAVAKGGLISVIIGLVIILIAGAIVASVRGSLAGF